MNDDWEFPAPQNDPEARGPAPAGGGQSCPRIVPDVNFVEGDIEEDEEGEPSP
ncbi:MAG: hypothetical protein ABIR60_04965 [Allosphingosinicella sp.]